VHGPTTCSAWGVGLQRSEFAFGVSHTLPAKDEQVQVSRHVLEAFAPLPPSAASVPRVSGGPSRPEADGCWTCSSPAAKARS
jgi:hypothetical protein